MLLTRAANIPEKGFHMDRKASLGFFPCHLSLSLTIVIYAVVQEGPLEFVESDMVLKKLSKRTVLAFLLK